MEAKIKRDRKINGIVFSLILFLILLLVLGAIYFIRATRPQRQAKAEAIAVAHNYANVTDVENFYWFTWGETYFSVLGKDSENNEVAVIIPQSGENIRVVNQSDGYTENEICSIVQQDYGNPAIIRANLGIHQDQVVWEVVTRDANHKIVYYLLDFATGAEISIVESV